MNVMHCYHLTACSYNVPSREASKKRPYNVVDLGSSEGDNGSNLFSASRTSAGMLADSSASSSDESVLDLTLSRRGAYITTIRTLHLLPAAACKCCLIYVRNNILQLPFTSQKCYSHHQSPARTPIKAQLYGKQRWQRGGGSRPRCHS